MQVISEKIQAVFEKQTAYQWVMRNNTASERVEMLIKLKQGLLARLEQFKQAIIADYKVPVAIAENQVYAIVQAIDYSVANLAQWMEPERVEQPAQGEAYIINEARGRVCIFGTWNAPLSVTIHPLIDALGAGNCAVIKPSEFTPAFNEVLVDLITSVFEEQEVAVVLGETEVAEALLKLPFDHFFFTGSPQVGKIIMREAANHLSAVTLELGGKSPAIIEPGYDMMRAAQTLVFGKVMFSGQFCISPDYIYVHSNDMANFAEAYNMLTYGILYDENGQLKEAETSQILNDRHFARLKGLYDDAIEKGAVLLSGGVFNEEARFIGPTLLGNVTEDMRITQEEIFGSITYVKTYEEVSEVITALQGIEKPLALYIYSDDKAFQQRVIVSTTSGGVTINGIAMHNTHNALPFGGVNNSGLGNFHGIHGFRTFSHQRAVFKM